MNILPDLLQKFSILSNNASEKSNILTKISKHIDSCIQFFFSYHYIFQKVKYFARTFKFAVFIFRIEWKLLTTEWISLKAGTMYSEKDNHAIKTRQKFWISIWQHQELVSVIYFASHKLIDKMFQIIYYKVLYSEAFTFTEDICSFVKRNVLLWKYRNEVYQNVIVIFFHEENSNTYIMIMFKIKRKNI